MKLELFIARKLKMGVDENDKSSSSPILNIALLGIVLAIVIMILSITIVCGFKNEISSKIYNIDSHIKIYNANNQSQDAHAKIDYNILNPILSNDSIQFIKSKELIAEKPAILKTNDSFKGIVYKGVGKDYDWGYIKNSIISGNIPEYNDTSFTSNILISQLVAKQLNLKLNDKILTYFVDDKIKVRNSLIVGIFNTDFEDFDKNFLIGNINVVQQINGWSASEGSYIGLRCNDYYNIENDTYSLYSSLMRDSYSKKKQDVYNITNAEQQNVSYFAWLDLLDMNVIIILILMVAVSSFTLIASLLIIVLKRVNMIGVLKALGASTTMIRNIFILLTQKLVLKALLYGNLIGLSISYLQYQFRIIKLNPEAYYMSYVPIEINITYILILNISIFAIAYLTLLIPSYIIATIKPSTSIRFE